MGKHQKISGKHRKQNTPVSQAAVVASIAVAAGAIGLVVRWVRAN